MCPHGRHSTPHTYSQCRGATVTRVEQLGGQLVVAGVAVRSAWLANEAQIAAHFRRGASRESRLARVRDLAQRRR